MNSIDKIDVSDLENVNIYMNSENKKVVLGNFKNLSTKITYTKTIMQKEQGKTGTIFVNDIQKVFFRESM